jgi:hypothetical protein
VTVVELMGTPCPSDRRNATGLVPSVALVR